MHTDLAACNVKHRSQVVKERQDGVAATDKILQAGRREVQYGRMWVSGGCGCVVSEKAGKQQQHRRTAPANQRLQKSDRDCMRLLFW